MSCGHLMFTDGGGGGMYCDRPLGHEGEHSRTVVIPVPTPWPQSPETIRSAARIDVVSRAITLSRQRNQVVGDKSDYYVTIEQLEEICQSLTTSKPDRG